MPNVHESPMQATRSTPARLPAANGALRKPSPLSAMRQTGFDRNSGGSHGRNLRNSAMRSRSDRTGVKMSTYARRASGMFFQINTGSERRIRRLSSHGGIGP